MNKLDETLIIKKFQKILGVKNFVLEDVESYNFGAKKIILKIDTLVASTDIPPKMSLGQAARKSVVACVSDFASKGIQPKAAIISVNLPSKITSKQVSEIAKGFKAASGEFGIEILGGDTNEGKEIVFSVCLFGSADGIVKRKGARPGDFIFVTGPFGYTSAGLQILLGNLRGKDSFSAKAKSSVLRPKPKLEYCLKNKNYFSSAMDSSDGLSTTLNEMARQSRCKFVINNIPAPKGIKGFAKKYKKSLEKLVFHGGEEYETVFTVSKANRAKIISNSKKTKTPIIEIGFVSKGNGVFLEEDQKLLPLKDLGWRHFRK